MGCNSGYFSFTDKDSVLASLKLILMMALISVATPNNAFARQKKCRLVDLRLFSTHPTGLRLVDDPNAWGAYARDFFANKTQFEELLNSSYPDEVLARVSHHFNVPQENFDVFTKNPHRLRELLDWLTYEMPEAYSAKNIYDQTKPVREALTEYSLKSLAAHQKNGRVGVFKEQVAVCRDLVELAHIALAKMGIESQILPHIVEDLTTGHMVLRVRNQIVDLNRATIWKPVPKKIENGFVIFQEKPEPRVIAYSTWRKLYSTNTKTLIKNGKYDTYKKVIHQSQPPLKKLLREKLLDPKGYVLVKPN